MNARCLTRPLAVWVWAVALCASAGAAACAPGTDGGPEPGSAEALLAQAQRAYQAGLTDQARRDCQAALQHDPGCGACLQLLGMAWRLEAERSPDPALGRHEIEAFERASQLEPGSLTARINLASSLLKQGHSQRAAEQLRQAAELAPTKPWARELVRLAERTDPEPGPGAGP